MNLRIYYESDMMQLDLNTESIVRWKEHIWNNRKLKL